MNGCQGDTRAPIGTIETRTLPAVSSPALAMERLNSTISEMMKSDSPPDNSGIIRLEVNPQTYLYILSLAIYIYNIKPFSLHQVIYGGYIYVTRGWLRLAYRIRDLIPYLPPKIVSKSPNDKLFSLPIIPRLDIKSKVFALSFRNK